MSILDLSERGALVETRFPLHLDSLHDFRLVLQAVPVIIKGRIVHSQVARARAGSRRLPHRPGIHRAFGTRTAGDPLVRRAPEAGRTRRASNRRRRTRRVGSFRTAPQHRCTPAVATRASEWNAIIAGHGTAAPTTYNNYIDGRWVPSGTGRTFENRNPANTDDLIGLFQDSGRARCRGGDRGGDARLRDAGASCLRRVRAEMLFKAAQLIAERKESVRARHDARDGEGSERDARATCRRPST